MTRAQLVTLAAMPDGCVADVESITLHPFSGDATLANADRGTLAILSPEGRFTYVAPSDRDGDRP